MNLSEPKSIAEKLEEVMLLRVRVRPFKRKGHKMYRVTSEIKYEELSSSWLMRRDPIYSVPHNLFLQEAFDELKEYSEPT
jgi:hypothetical protein